jgi:hypothetical protein
MATALRPYFLHCCITWNSGNFYTIIASNSLANIRGFISCLGEPAIPSEYLYEALPRPLLEILRIKAGLSRQYGLYSFVY